MNKLLLTGVMLATMTTACVAGPNGFQDNFQGWRAILSPQLNLRECPDPRCPIVAKLPQGLDVHITNIPIGARAGWVAIEAEMKTQYQKTQYRGYVNGTYLGPPNE
jgi:hypothetical protein